jgi:hypothetical protein
MQHNFKGVKETPSEDGIVGIHMSTMSKDIYSVWAFDSMPKDTGRDMDPIGSIFFPLKL